MKYDGSMTEAHGAACARAGSMSVLVLLHTSTFSPCTHRTSMHPPRTLSTCIHQLFRHAVQSPCSARRTYVHQLFRHAPTVHPRPHPAHHRHTYTHQLFRHAAHPRHTYINFFAMQCNRTHAYIRVIINLFAMQLRLYHVQDIDLPSCVIRSCPQQLLLSKFC